MRIPDDFIEEQAEIYLIFHVSHTTFIEYLYYKWDMYQRVVKKRLKLD